MTATAAQLCAELAKAIPMPTDEVSRYARALITSGDLPKASGRNVPTLDMRDRAKLILAIAGSDRPSGSPRAMRERYDAKIFRGECDQSAGEVLAAELEEIAAGGFESMQKWTHSDIEVSRGKQPRVRFRINENMRGFDGFDGHQPLFIGGAYRATTADEMQRLLIDEHSCPGLPVNAIVPGRILILLALGSAEAVFAHERTLLGSHQND